MATEPIYIESDDSDTTPQASQRPNPQNVNQRGRQTPHGTGQLFAAQYPPQPTGYFPPQPAGPYPPQTGLPCWPQGGFYLQPGFQGLPQPGYPFMPSPYGQFPPPQYPGPLPPQPPIPVSPQGELDTQPASRRPFQPSLPLVPQRGLYPQTADQNQPDIQARQPGRDVMMADVLKDRNVMATRGPGLCISSQDHLVLEDKIRLFDLLEQYQTVQRQRGHFWLAVETDRRFYQEILSDWNTRVGVGIPDIRPRIMSASHVEVGYRARNQPGNQREGARNAPKVRKQGAPVYLSLDLEAEGISWLYKDKGGNRVQVRDLVLLPGLSEAQAKKNVLDNFDQNEKARTCDYNTQQIISAARRRLVKWAAAGSDVQLLVDAEDRVTSLAPLELAYDYFDAQHKKNCAVAELCLQRPKPGYKD